MHDCNDRPSRSDACAGNVPGGVNTLSPPTTTPTLQDSRAQAALGCGGAAAVAAVGHGTGRARGQGIVAASTGPLPDDAGHGHLVAVHCRCRRRPRLTRRHGFWLYSSGSTGRPKGTVHTHGNPYWTAELYGTPVLGLTERDTCFSAAKLYFAYGLGNALTFPLSVGASVVLMAERPTPDAIFKRWTQERPTVFFGAPTGYAGMLAHPALPSREQVAPRPRPPAKPCRPRSAALQRALRCRDHRRYRLEEMRTSTCPTGPARWLRHHGLAGPRLRGRVRDDDGRPVPRAARTSACACRRMYRATPRSRAPRPGLWTKSGDKYIRNDDGTYTYAAAATTCSR